VIKILKHGSDNKSLKLVVKNNLEIKACLGEGLAENNSKERLISTNWDPKLKDSGTLEKLKAHLKTGSTIKLDIQSGFSMGKNGPVKFEFMTC